MMEVTLSFDHRVIDGGLAQQFLAVVQRNLEDAVRLLA
jgi:pyruvate/2-oxoglutarate dehydrogenase complex dihydrolipoamide acyltransferase (E2) component